MKINSNLYILVPVYNEENTIIQVLTKLNEVCKSITNKEIIVVDDGSTDDTPKLLRSNKKLYSKLVTSQVNKGKGSAIILGLNEIAGGYILIQDADLEYDPNEIPRLWDIVINNDIDVLLTSRLSGSPLTRVHYFWHKLGNRSITLMFNVMNNTTFTDIYSGYIIFKRNLIDAKNLKFYGWGQQAEILTYLKKKSKKIYEAPISYKGRTYEEGKKINAYAMAPVIFAIVWTRIRILFSKKVNH
jgi:glycosyltransferase involved in cell wall biosynthesis